MMKKILIVDDEPHVIRVLKLALERAGYEVESAFNGENALAKIRQCQPDLMITDIQMPRMDGKALCQRIDQEFPGRLFPIYVTTSRPEYEHRAWSSEIDNLRFFEKPLSPRNLVDMLKSNHDNPPLHSVQS